MACDLHTHTTASDGLLSPTELVQLAAAKDLKAVGITDHDTVGGLAEAIKAGHSYNISIVPGVELSTECDGLEIHILGYYIAWQEPRFLAFLENMRQERQRRNLKIVARLQELGYDIKMEDVEKKALGDTVGRPHIAAALTEKGYVPSIKSAFDTLLKKGQAAYAPRDAISPAEAIKLILTAGGVPVLAHPGVNRSDIYIQDMLAKGLQGIEVYYPLHDEPLVKYYLGLAAKYSLLATGGSDFHGHPGDSHGDLGACQIDIGTVRQLQRRAKSLEKNK